MKPQSTKGFTLIELMIVVAIIGVLAVTIVPALTGAQARARDAGRKASLQNISAVLETYLSDNGEFPKATATAANDDTGYKGCISSGSGATAPSLANMFKGQLAPVNPQKNSITAPCGQGGAYGYVPLVKGGIDRGGYILTADVEQYQNSTAQIASAAAFTSLTGLGNDATNDKYDTFVGSSATAITYSKISSDTSPATNSIITVAN